MKMCIRDRLNIKGNTTMGKEAKTNAMRILEREKVPYTAHEYMAAATISKVLPAPTS